MQIVKQNDFFQKIYFQKKSFQNKSRKIWNKVTYDPYIMCSQRDHKKSESNKKLSKK